MYPCFGKLPWAGAWRWQKWQQPQQVSQAAPWHWTHWDQNGHSNSQSVIIVRIYQKDSQKYAIMQMFFKKQVAMFKNVSDTDYQPLTHGVFFVFILQTLMATMVFLWANSTSSIDLSRVEIRPVVIPIDLLWRWSCLWDTQSRGVVLCCCQCGSFGWHLHTLALYSNQKAFRALHTLFQFNSFVWCFFVQEIQTNIVT